MEERYCPQSRHRKRRLSCSSHTANKWQSWDSNPGIPSRLPAAKDQPITVTHPGLWRDVRWPRSTWNLLIDESSGSISVASVHYLCEMGHGWLHFLLSIFSSFSPPKTVFWVCSVNSSSSSNHIFVDPSPRFPSLPFLPPPSFNLTCIPGWAHQFL